VLRWNRCVLLFASLAAPMPVVVLASASSATPVVRGKVISVQDKLINSRRLANPMSIT